MSAAEDVAAAMPELERWIGRTRVVEEEIALSAVRRIAATFDLPPEDFERGSALPPHWFNMFFHDNALTAAIGPDGHPRKGEFLPPIPLPRRMGAGRRVRIQDCLHVGDAATKRVAVAAITPKTARTGQIVVLTMRQTFLARGLTIAEEEFDAVYREAVPPGGASKATPPAPAPTDGVWADRAVADPVLLFRYSAITWNAHRIHYDADYTRGEEGYPGVVQNGGLTMQMLLDAGLKRLPGRITGYTARLVRPLFVGDALTLCGAAPEAGKMRVWVADKDGLLAAEMVLEFGA